MADTIRFKRGSGAPPTLLSGEPAFDTDDGVLYVGDGTTNHLIGPGPEFRLAVPQATPATTWTVTHNLGGFPAVTTVDSTGAVAHGRVEYLDANSLQILFTAPFSGTTYLS